MRLPALTALLTACLLSAVPAAHADPLLCVDPGPTHVGPYTVDLPEVCTV